MTLPAFAEVEDLAARISGGIAESDETRAQAALDDASALIRSVAGKTWVTGTALDDDVPDVVRTICIAAARRAFTNPDDVQSETIGTASRTYASTSLDVYLTKAEREFIRQAAGKTGVWALPTTRGTLGDVDPTDPCLAIVGSSGDEYLPTDSGEPIIWLGPDGY